MAVFIDPLPSISRGAAKNALPHPARPRQRSRPEATAASHERTNSGHVLASFHVSAYPAGFRALDAGHKPAHPRRALDERDIKCLKLMKKGIESSEKLGRWRWVVGRTLSWTNRNRRLKVRHERRDDIHQAFLALSCSLICWNHVQRLC